MHFSRLTPTISFQMSPERHVPYTGIHLYPSHFHTLQKLVWTSSPFCVCSPAGTGCQKWDLKASNPARQWPPEFSKVLTLSPLCSSLPWIATCFCFGESLLRLQVLLFLRFELSNFIWDLESLCRFRGKVLSIPVQDFIFGEYSVVVWSMEWQDSFWGIELWSRNSFYSFWNLG